MKVQTFPEAFGGLIALNFANLARLSHGHPMARVTAPCPHELNNHGPCEEDVMVTVECTPAEPMTRDYPGSDASFDVIGYTDCPRGCQLTPTEYLSLCDRAVGQVRDGEVL